MKEIFNLCTWWKCCSSKTFYKKSKFYTFSQARGYTAGVSQKAARHRWHRGITCCIPPMGLVKLPAEKTNRKTSTHFAHLRMFVYSWVFAATTASFVKIWFIFHQPPTSPEILCNLGEIPNLKIHSATSPNFASSRATSSSQSWRNFSRSATCIWKVDTHHQAKRTRRS